MTINELYRENEELRNTVTFIHSQLEARPPSRSRSPSRMRATTLDGSTGTEMLVLENKDLREKLSLADKKLRASQTVKRRYEQALERANSILEQHTNSSPEMEARVRELEKERNSLKLECSRLVESEQTALEECERVHTICHELQGLLDTTTSALSEQTRVCEMSSVRIQELEDHLGHVMQECSVLRSQVDTQVPQQPRTQSPIPPQDSDTKQYAELVRRLETQFNNSQRQLESVTAEKQRTEGSYRAAQAECAELRNTLARYETSTRDLRSQLSDREGRVQALESAKSLLSNAMFKTEQENKQLLWQLKAVQGADERLTKTQEQLHQLQAQSIDQTRELKHLRDAAAKAEHFEEAHRQVSHESLRLHEALKISRDENNRLLEEVHTLQQQLHGLVRERAIIFGELGRMNVTCSELAGLVT